MNRPQGSGREAKFQQWVWDSITGILNTTRAPGQLTSFTPSGVSQKPILMARASGPQRIFPEREVDVCVIDDDGTQRDGFMKVHGSIIYFKDAQGNPVDANGVAIDPADLVP